MTYEPPQDHVKMQQVSIQVVVNSIVTEKNGRQRPDAYRTFDFPVWGPGAIHLETAIDNLRGHISDLMKGSS